MADTFVHSDDPALQQAITELVALIDKRLQAAAGEPMEFMLFAVKGSDEEVTISIGFNHDNPKELLTALEVWLANTKERLAAWVHQNRRRRQQKSRPVGRLFELVAGAGFEPTTFRL